MNSKERYRRVLYDELRVLPDGHLDEIHRTGP